MRPTPLTEISCKSCKYFWTLRSGRIHGRDKGKGWLLDHPLKKMLIFQQFCLNNPEFMDSDLKLGAWLAEEEEGSDEDEDIENIPVYQSEREVSGNLSELLESAGTITPSKKTKSPSKKSSSKKSPSKSPSAKKSRTPVKSPRKGGDPATPPFVVKQVTPQKKSAKDILASIFAKLPAYVEFNYEGEGKWFKGNLYRKNGSIIFDAKGGGWSVPDINPKEEEHLFKLISKKKAL